MVCSFFLGFFHGFSRFHSFWSLRKSGIRLERLNYIKLMISSRIVACSSRSSLHFVAQNLLLAVLDLGLHLTLRPSNSCEVYAVVFCLTSITNSYYMLLSYNLYNLYKYISLYIICYIICYMIYDAICRFCRLFHNFEPDAPLDAWSPS